MDFSAGLSFNAFSLAAQGLATVFSASSAKAVTKYNNAVAQAQADIARINAKTMEDQYAQRLFAAESQYQQETMRAGRVKQQQKVALAANGLAVGVGSAAELQASTDIIKKIDLQRIESNAKAEAWGYRSKATDYENQAIMAEAKKQNASQVFANTLLGGIGQIGFGWAAGKLATSLTAEASKTKTEQPKTKPSLQVDAISSAQPSLLIDATSSAQPAKTTKMYQTTNKFSPMYGVK
ncbi:hypothetical protein [Turicimonas muris]|uniref:hypothetical protein n=2 Tax=Turicimonas muris TaxID=1796652 RepID=UPI0025A61E5B|nr:hypothetical protein [Turicimonas muris]